MCSHSCWHPAATIAVIPLGRTCSMACAAACGKQNVVPDIYFALQVSAFYVSPDPPRYLVRFCFCKADEKLHKACDLLEKYFAR